MKKGLVLIGLAIMSTIAHAQPATVPPDDDAVEASRAVYETRFIAFADEYSAHVTVHDHGFMATGTVKYERNAVAFRGIQRERLDGAAFYEAVGETELAARYRRRARTRTMLGVGSVGGVIATGALAVMAVVSLPGIEHDDCDVFLPDFRMCVEAHQAAEEVRRDEANARARRYAIAGGVSLVGTLVLAGIYRSFDPQPVGESARRMMAHDHNERLRKELGLRRRPLSFQPFVHGDGAGVMALGRF